MHNSWRPFALQHQPSCGLDAAIAQPFSPTWGSGTAYRWILSYRTIHKLPQAALMRARMPSWEQTQWLSKRREGGWKVESRICLRDIDGWMVGCWRWPHFKKEGGCVTEKGERRILWHLSVTMDIEFVERDVNWKCVRKHQLFPSLNLQPNWKCVSFSLTHHPRSRCWVCV